ncbi:PREDICTED: serine/threonine-protein phosphatase 7 long form homolog [Erythranthe guttata]|uniref:serine/threonine-protein phosphatase 7 long form homolog n=1 Tax=Erythranthe guttata TaxID=4155 RepID=UPI00064E0331|nr:PREDICTED: serine/threonine-protein phosphatase 7 long form homolog [Erythranthe guttata]|eukprot:XP_012856899.1 PREDICTED: serine/threonine-protein phosphatase 7 long form homolog [Erythranthe guttata]
MQLIYTMGFYGVYRCRRMKVDFHLITALIERWREETHTFHFRVGEATITLQDIVLLWGLPIDGIPVIGTDYTYCTTAWIDYCEALLGFRPEPNYLRGGKLKVLALTNYLVDNSVNDQSSDVRVAQFTRALAFMLFGGIMIPDSTGNAIPLMYLKHFEDIDAVRSYSWGSAALAVLYHELCKATLRGERRDVVGGPMQLLQLWAWTRIRHIAPIPKPLRDYDPITVLQLNADDVFRVPPYGAR